MISKTKTIPLVFAFAVMMLAWPMTVQTATAQGGGGSDPVCDLTIPGPIAMGNIVPGADTTETSEQIWVTGGNVDGTIEVVAGDWLGVGTRASGAIVLDTVVAGDTLEVNGQLMTATVVGTAGANEFDVGANDGSDDVTTATNLAAKITSEAQTTTIGGVDPVAISTVNVVIVRSDVVGTIGNTMPMTNAAATMTADALLSDGEATLVKHAESSMTKFTISTSGADTTGNTYTAKTGQMPTDETDTLVMAPRSDVTVDTTVTFQITGVATLVALPYSGVLNQALTFTFTCFPA